MPTLQPPVLPACANCVTSVQPAAGAAPPQTPSSMLRSSDGKLRIDMPNTTVITNPAAQQAIVLDHLTKQAQILPLQMQPPQIPQPPVPPAGAPQPGAPKMPSVTVQDLGKSLIEGHPVEGKRFTAQPPALPQAPQVPGAPNAPQVPQAPPAPTISEVWTSTHFKMPVLTKITTPGGVQTTYCKPSAAAEPDPSLFQVPPGYKVVTLKPPSS